MEHIVGKASFHVTSWGQEGCGLDIRGRVEFIGDCENERNRLEISVIGGFGWRDWNCDSRVGWDGDCLCVTG